MTTEPDRPILTVPKGDLKFPDGRRLREWNAVDPRRTMWRRMAGLGPHEGRRTFMGSLLDVNGWDGPKRMIVLCTLEPSRLGRLLHASVSYQDRDPAWADIKAVRAALFPDTLDVMMLLPRSEDYIAGIAPVLDRTGREIVHGAPGGADSHVFQLVQCPDRWSDL
jgi:hypothetical protein